MGNCRYISYLCPAKSSAACCPHGCFEGKITNASLEELIDMEEVALEEVHAANKALERARIHALMSREAKKAPMKTALKKRKVETTEPLSKKDNGTARSHRKLPLLGNTDFPLDFGTVKNLVGNETMRNLMGKDSGGVSSEHKKGHRKVHSMEKVHFPSDFDLELQLFKQGNQQQGSSNGFPPARRERCWSEAVPSSPPNNFPEPNETFTSSLPELPTDKAAQKCSSSYLRVCTTEDKKESQILDDDSFVSIYEEDHPLKQQERRPEHHTYCGPQGKEASDTEAFPLKTNRDNPELLPVDVPDRRSLLRKENSAYHASTVWDVVDLGTEDPQETMLSTGAWKISSITEIFSMLFSGIRKLLSWTSEKSNAAVDLVVSQGTYAVVTFTSRQAAVAARKVLADGRGSYRFNQFSSLPIPPLADAAPGDVCAFHSCCRPVTMSINDGQKKSRNTIALVLLCLIYFFYTVSCKRYGYIFNFDCYD